MHCAHRVVEVWAKADGGRVAVLTRVYELPSQTVGAFNGSHLAPDGAIGGLRVAAIMLCAPGAQHRRAVDEATLLRLVIDADGRSGIAPRARPRARSGLKGRPGEEEEVTAGDAAARGHCARKARKGVVVAAEVSKMASAQDGDAWSLLREAPRGCGGVSRWSSHCAHTYHAVPVVKPDVGARKGARAKDLAA
eukprot:1666299-Prymnesium_polylepis.2